MNNESQPEVHLKLTVADLCPAFRDKKNIPASPKFFHFMDTKTAKQFQEATLITFAHPNGSEVIIKDLYNRRIK